MKRRLSATLAGLGTAIAMLAVAAPAALAASDDGEGLVGQTDDKIVTFVALGVLVFFIAFVIIASILQGRGDKRKAAMKAARARQRIGW